MERLDLGNLLGKDLARGGPAGPRVAQVDIATVRSPMLREKCGEGAGLLVLGADALRERIAEGQVPHRAAGGLPATAAHQYSSGTGKHGHSPRAQPHALMIAACLSSSASTTAGF